MTDLRFLLQDLFNAGDEGNLDAFDAILDKNVIVHAPAGLSTVGIQQEKNHGKGVNPSYPIYGISSWNCWETVPWLQPGASLAVHSMGS